MYFVKINGCVHNYGGDSNTDFIRFIPSQLKCQQGDLEIFEASNESVIAELDGVNGRFRFEIDSDNDILKIKKVIDGYMKGEKDPDCEEVNCIDCCKLEEDSEDLAMTQYGQDISLVKINPWPYDSNMVFQGNSSL